MRVIIATVATAAAILSADTGPAAAQNTTRPYCLRDGVNGQGTWDCTYYSMDQCRATASGAGGSCQPNPWYQGRRPQEPYRR